MSPLAFSEMLATKPVERPKSNRLTISVFGDDEAQVTNAARAVRFGMGCLSATTESHNLPAETSEQGGFQKMAGVTVRIEACHDCGGPEWPHNKEVFEAYFAVVPAAEHEHGVDVHWIDPPESVQAVMSDYGRMGVVTDELFDLSVQGQLEELGVHKVCAQFWFEDRTDHEGNRDCEFGFDILSVEEVK